MTGNRVGNDWAAGKDSETLGSIHTYCTLCIVHVHVGEYKNGSSRDEDDLQGMY